MLTKTDNSELAIHENNKIRARADFSTRLNNCLKTYNYPLPSLEDIFAKLSNVKYFKNWICRRRVCKVKVRSSDGDRLLRLCDRYAARRHISRILFVICQDYVLRMSIDIIKDNGFKLPKERSRGKTITDADYADDIALLANSPIEAGTLQHGLERAAAGIGLRVNAHKTE